MSDGKLTGYVTRLEPNGFGVVKLDNGRDAFFDRFALRASQGGRDLRPGSRVVGEAASPEADVVRLASIGLLAGPPV